MGLAQFSPKEVCEVPEKVGAKSGLSSVTSQKGNQATLGKVIAD